MVSGINICVNVRSLPLGLAHPFLILLELRCRLLRGVFGGPVRDGDNSCCWRCGLSKDVCGGGGGRGGGGCSTG